MIHKFSVFWYLSKFKMTRFNLLSVAFGYFYALNQGTIDWAQFGYLMLGTLFICTSCFSLNQVLEVKQDALMDRTKARPLPLGQITILGALVYGLFCGILGIVILWLNINFAVTLIGLCILVSYVLIYTPLKKVTTLSTLIGGVPGALPPIMGWLTVQSQVTLDGLVIFFIFFFWQIPHFLALDWIYREDYAKAKFVMLSSKDSSGGLTFRQMIIQILILIVVSVLPFTLGTAHWTYLLAALVIGILFLNKAVLLYIRRTEKAALSVFLFSLLYLPVIMVFLANPFFK